MKPRTFIRNIHKWFGLIGGIWILVLGFTGLMLDHRDDWGWAWRTHVPNAIIPNHTVDALKTRHITLAQANPNNDQHWVIGGPTGLWLSKDGTKTWNALEFENLKSSPMVFSIVLDTALGWEKIWFATDDGIWSFMPQSTNKLVKHEGLKGRYLTALDNGSEPQNFVVIEDRSDIVFWSADTKSEVKSISTNQTKVSGLPEKVGWSRFLFDMHLGRSFFDRSYNMMMNDFGALAMIVLSVTGFLQWYFVRRWRGKSQISTETKKSIFKTLYNSHAPIIGLLSLFPIIYLSFTGIIMDHRNEWMMPLVRNQISRDILPNVYDFGSLNKEISHVIAYPDNEKKLTVGTRLGVLTTNDGGAEWEREKGNPMSPGFVWSLKRQGNQLFFGGLGGPSFVRNLSDTNWSMIDGLRGMPSDATVSNNQWYAISGANMFIGDTTSGMSASPFNIPIMSYQPLMLLMFELHNGKIIATWFKYILDILAIFTIVMAITGPILWWRKKWAR